jgi:hypothetical protein
MIELILAAALAFSVAHPEVKLEITIEVEAAISDHSVTRSCRRNGRWAGDVPRALRRFRTAPTALPRARRGRPCPWGNQLLVSDDHIKRGVARSPQKTAPETP